MSLGISANAQEPVSSNTQDNENATENFISSADIQESKAIRNLYGYSENSDNEIVSELFHQQIIRNKIEESGITLTIEEKNYIHESVVDTFNLINKAAAGDINDKERASEVENARKILSAAHNEAEYLGLNWQQFLQKQEEGRQYLALKSKLIETFGSFASFDAYVNTAIEQSTNNYSVIQYRSNPEATIGSFKLGLQMKRAGEKLTLAEPRDSSHLSTSTASNDGVSTLAAIRTNTSVGIRKEAVASNVYHVNVSASFTYPLDYYSSEICTYFVTFNNLEATYRNADLGISYSQQEAILPAGYWGESYISDQLTLDSPGTVVGKATYVLSWSSNCMPRVDHWTSSASATL